MQFSLKISANFIKLQNCLGAKLLKPLLQNCVWTNGRLCAFEQDQSGFLKMNTLSTIKVLLVTVAFENRVGFIKKCLYVKHLVFPLEFQQPPEYGI